MKRTSRQTGVAAASGVSFHPQPHTRNPRCQAARVEGCASFLAMSGATLGHGRSCAPPFAVSVAHDAKQVGNLFLQIRLGVHRAGDLIFKVTAKTPAHAMHRHPKRAGRHACCGGCLRIP